MSDILVPSPNNGYAMPFFYGAIRSCWVYYCVDPATADDLLTNSTGGDTGMVATRFTHNGGTTALACLNFMHYPAMGNSYGSFTTELEVNVVAHPIAKAASIPALTVQEFLYGWEQTKLVGYYRLHVVADNAVAIEAGRSVFGEYKYFGAFTYDVPTYNLTLPQSDPAAVGNWQFAPHVNGGVPYDISNPANYPEPNFTLTMTLGNLQPAMQSSQTALTDYSMWSAFSADQVNPNTTPVPPIGATLNGSRRNYLGALVTYWIDDSTASNIQLAYGPNDNDLLLTTHMQTLLDGAAPVAAATIRSEPAVIESPAYFVDRI